MPKDQRAPVPGGWRWSNRDPFGFPSCTERARGRQGLRRDAGRRCDDGICLVAARVDATTSRFTDERSPLPGRHVPSDVCPVQRTSRWSGAASIRGPHAFQARALPTELPDRATGRQRPGACGDPAADLTGFEPATSALTGRRALRAAPQVLGGGERRRAPRTGRASR